MVVGDDCITVVGNGNAGTPYSISTLLDPDATNQLACGVPGLFVPPPSIEVADTNCVDLNGTGFPGDPVTAALTLDPEACNLIKCSATGLDAQIHILDSDCIDLSGCGTVGNPLTADLITSPDALNIFECRANGAYVPASGAGAIGFQGEIELLSAGFPQTFVSGGASQVSGTVLFDTVINNLGGVTDVANNRFVIPAGGAGWYDIEAHLATAGPNYNLNGGSVLGYRMVAQIRIGGATTFRFGTNTEPVDNSSTSFRTLNVFRNGIYLAVADTVDLVFTFQDISAGAIGNQDVQQGSFMSIIRTGV